MGQPLMLLLILYALIHTTNLTSTAEATESLPDWQYEMTDGMENKYYWDPASRITNGSKVIYKEKTEYGPHLRRTLSQLSQKPIFFDINDTEIDCTEKTVQRGLLKPDPINPDTPMHEVLTKICTPKTK